MTNLVTTFIRTCQLLTYLYFALLFVFVLDIIEEDEENLIILKIHIMYGIYNGMLALLTNDSKFIFLRMDFSHFIEPIGNNFMG